MNTFTVTLRRGSGGDGWGGESTYDTHEIDGCIRWPRNSSESLDRSDVVLSGWVLVVPSGSDVRPTDEIQMPGGDDWWQVEGDPMATDHPYATPFSSWDPGVPVALTRTRG